MRQRGRPPHPDILTPREWEVLSLLREGLSNREIGDELGVTRDGIKYHVTQILLKLGVATREEAAAWHPVAPVDIAPANRFTARLSGISRLGLIGAAGVLLAGVAALGGAVAYNEIAGGGSSTDPADVSAGGPPTPGPYGVPTPTPFGTPIPPYDASNNALGSVADVRDGNLWLLNLDTGDDWIIVQREVATTFGTTAKDLTAFDPEWSVDGQWIAFGINNTAIGYTTMWVVRPGDGRLESGSGATAWEWSPTTNAITSSIEVPRQPTQDYNASGQLLTSFHQGEGKWSPDGKSYVRPDALGPRLDPQHSDAGSAPYIIRLIDTAVVSGPTLTPTQSQPGVTTIFTENSAPGPPVIQSWSPDGKYIVFWTGVGPTVGTNADIALVSVDNPSDVKTIGQSRVVPSAAAWSPDGSLLALSSGDSKSIEVLSEDGTVQAHVGGDDSASVEPAWSPDGASIAFAKSGGIWVAATDGSGLTRLTNDRAYSDRDPQWSSDGSRIVFVRLSASAVDERVAGPVELWMMNANGSDAHKIGDLPSIDLQTQGLGGFDMDWGQYFSWYRPSAATVPTPTASPFVAPTATPCISCDVSSPSTARID
jgi:Tol biopolymer transport system component/DNA-binding CsgD family transcriptional regulator